MEGYFGSVTNVPANSNEKSAGNAAGGLRTGLSPAQARRFAQEAGFAEAELVALPHAAQARDAERFSAWIAAGRAATMRYLERRGEDGKLLRERVENPFPWARSAIVCFAGYRNDEPFSTSAAGSGAGWIARYAWSSKVVRDGKDAAGRRQPSDYHKVLKKRLEALELRVRSELGSAFEARGYVDTGPVVERSLAVAAGLGWTGKNTCLIHPRLGSFGFLAVLLTSLPVELDAGVGLAVHPDRCGTCRRCIEACPTDALTEPYRMDAAKCISYLTIEHKGPVADELMAGMGRQVFGCDICQDVCPWNSPRRTPIAVDAELEPRAELVNPALEWLGSLDEAEFEKQFNGSPVRRTGFLGLRRNVAIAMGNSGQSRFAGLLEAWAGAADEGVRTAARWALKRLG
jgi:epoxyqueuosine reductase